jgi:hypothetical protein
LQAAVKESGWHDTIAPPSSMSSTRVDVVFEGGRTHFAAADRSRNTFRIIEIISLLPQFCHAEKNGFHAALYAQVRLHASCIDAATKHREEGPLNPNPLRIGIVGAGNCASSLVQGLTYYRDAPDDAVIPGPMNPRVGRYHVRDVEVACAFDIHAGKVGRDLAEALQCEPNNTRIFAKLPRTGVRVRRGPTLDGLGTYLRDDTSRRWKPSTSGCPNSSSDCCRTTWW